MSEVATQLNEIINDTKMIQNNIRLFHDTGVKWYQDLKNSFQQLQVMGYLKEEFNLTLSNSTLQQNLFEKFTEEKGMHCDKFPFGTLNWTKCNFYSVANDYESGTQNIVKNIRKQIFELVNKIDIQINQLNNTISSTNSEIEHLRYLSHFGTNTSNLTSLFIDSKNNLKAMHTYLIDIDQSLDNFSFYQFQGYSTGPRQQEFERKLEGAINTLQIAEQSIEQSKNNILDQKTRINSIAQKITDRLEQPSSPVGTLPVGFDELVSVFPIALAGSFLVCLSSFIDAIRLRKEFQDIYKDSGKNSITDQQISSIAPLWLDPLRREQNKKARFAIFLIPFVIFVAACVLIVYNWTGPNMSIGGEYTNRYVFGGLYLLSGGLFVYGYLKTIKEYRHYANENASNLRKRQQLQSRMDNSINSVNNNIDNTMAYNTTKDVPDSNRLEVEKHSDNRQD
jgi:hypothetical protein